MNLEICKNCNHLKYLPIRYLCKKDYVYINKDRKFLRDRALQETYENLPCPEHKNIIRNIEHCKFCEHFREEEIRVKCRLIAGSWFYLNRFKSSKYIDYNKCKYNFEQQISELNK